MGTDGGAGGQRQNPTGMPLPWRQSPCGTGLTAGELTPRQRSLCTVQLGSEPHGTRALLRKAPAMGGWAGWWGDLGPGSFGYRSGHREEMPTIDRPCHGSVPPSTKWKTSMGSHRTCPVSNIIHTRPVWSVRMTNQNGHRMCKMTPWFESRSP